METQHTTLTTSGHWTHIMCSTQSLCQLSLSLVPMSVYWITLGTLHLVLPIVFYSSIPDVVRVCGHCGQRCEELDIIPWAPDMVTPWYHDHYSEWAFVTANQNPGWVRSDQWVASSWSVAVCEHSRCLAAICLIFIVSQFDDWIINVKITITKINFCNLLKPLAIQLKRCKDLKVKVMVSLAFHIASGQTGVVMAGSYE